MSPSAALIGAGLGDHAAVAARIDGFARGLHARGWEITTIDVADGTASRTRPIRDRMPSTAARLVLQAGWEGDIQPSIGWHARRQLRGLETDTAVVSVPPFSLLPAAAVALRPGTALIVDYRDPWSARHRPSPLAQLTRSVERRAMRRVTAVTYAGGAELGALLATRLGLNRSRVVAVPNGFDPIDAAAFSGHAPRVERNGRSLDLVFGGYWYGRNGPGVLLDALATVGPAVAELTVVGGVSREIAAEFRRRAGRTPHQDQPTERSSLYDRVARADAVVIPLDHASAVESRIPAKAYDCLAVGVPVIAVCPRGAALLDVPGAHRFHHVHHDDPGALVELLRSAMRDRTILRSAPPATGPTRDQGAETLHRLLRSLTCPPRSEPPMSCS